MADKQLGAKLKALLFSLLNACKILLVFTLMLNYVNANSTCTDTQVTIDLGNGTFQCEDCLRCPLGHGISHKCGDFIDGEARYICKQCLPGESYSDKDDLLQCKKCDSCMEGEVVVHPCDERTNVQCGKSCVDPNRYFDEERGCLNCSCCGDGNNTLVEECERKMEAESNMICSFNSSATGCEFTSPSTQTVNTISHVTSFTIRPSTQSISNRDSTPPLPQDETNSSPDATSTQVTSRIDPTEAISELLLIAPVIVSLLVFFGMVVATSFFLYRRKVKRMLRNRAMNADLEMQPYLIIRQKPEERPPVGPREIFKTPTVDSCTLLISCGDSYSVPAASSTKLRAGSLTIQSGIDFDLEPSFKYPGVSSQIRDTIVEALIDDEDATMNDLSCTRKENHKRRNSSLSYKSTSSETSRMLWNITNLPENIDPKMVAWGLVDHNGGKFTIGNTRVSLIVPPQAIPEGHTEGIFIAIVNQEEEHPQLGGKEALLSPVVKCGPNGIKFQRPVILSMPHCALLENGAWNLKVQYNENDPGVADDWKQLTDANKQDGSVPNLVLLEEDMVHLIIDHFTNFVMKGGSASSQVVAKKSVRIVAYVTPPETSGDCIVRVYCVGDTPMHLEMVHYEETERLGGIRVDAPKPFHFRNGAGDLLVKLTDYHRGWIHTTADMKRIRFQHIWDGIECMPSCSSVFTMRDEFVSQFRATFEVEQDCQDGDEQEVIVSTAIKQRQSSVSEKSKSNNKATEQTCTENSLQDITASDLLGAVAASPLQMAHTSSGYFSFGFEPLPELDSLPQRIRSELIISLDPPHPKADWRTLAEGLDFKMKYIRFLESLKPPASPTDTLLNILEAKKFPLCELAERLHGMGREDAAAILEEALVLRETNV